MNTSTNTLGHRIDLDGVRSWWIDGRLHREDGPAIIGANGNWHWYLNGNRYLDKMKFQRDANISDEDMTILLLKYNWS